MALKLITPPSIYPVTIDEVMAHCRIDSSLEEDYLNSLIIAASAMAEHITASQLVAATREYVLPYLCKPFHGKYDPKIYLPKPPLTSISYIKYYDDANTLQTLSSSKYFADVYSMPGYVTPVYGYEWPSTYPREDAVFIRYTCGYPTTTSNGSTVATTPESVRRWILITIGTMYENREGTTQYSSNQITRQYIDGLLDPYRYPEVY